MSKPPSQFHRITIALLGLMVLFCGFFVRASEPLSALDTVIATALPQQVRETLPPVTAAPEETLPAATQTPTASPTAPPTQAPTAAPTQAPTEAPTQVAVMHLTPTQVPTAAAGEQQPSQEASEADYTYVSDTLRVEITRHEDKNLVYFATEVWLTDVGQLRSAFSSDQFDGPTEPVSDIAERHSAIIAVNGDFATFNNGGIIIRNGDIYRTNRSTRQLLVIDQEGNFIPYLEPPENAEEMAAQFHTEGVWQTLVFGPVLVDEGKAVELPKKFFINTKGALEPRTAIGQLGPLHYLILTVDGRQDGYSKGVSLGRLQELFLSYGAVTAFNLDGGGSTSLCFHGDVLNQPANGGERHVPDILYIVD